MSLRKETTLKINESANFLFLQKQIGNTLLGPPDTLDITQADRTTAQRGQLGCRRQLRSSTDIAGRQHLPRSCDQTVQL